MGRMAPFSRARTYWLGRRTPLGLSTLARIRKVPVCGLKEESAKVIRPVCGKTVPSTRMISTTKLLFRGMRISPFFSWSRNAAIWFSERLKLTHMGESTATVVRRLFAWLM